MEFDELPGVFAEDLYESGDSLRTLSYTLSGLGFLVPSLARKMHGAWRLHSAWKRLEPPRRTPPLTTAMTQAIAGQFLQMGFPGCAMGVLLGYHCLLRTAEMLSLHVSDIKVSRRTFHLLLKETNIGQRLGQNEMCNVDDNFLRDLCKVVASTKQSEALVCELGAYAFRRRWHSALRALQYPAGYLPYGLRRGGATSNFRLHGSFDRISDRGRGKNSQTTQVYINEAMQDVSTNWDSSSLSVHSAESLASLRISLEGLGVKHLNLEA